MCKVQAIMPSLCPWGIVFGASLVYFSMSAVAVEGEAMTAALRDSVLNKHNQYRGVPKASNMRKLKWNYDLETMAQLWADQCNASHGQPDCTDSPYAPNIGQNLYVSSSDDIGDLTNPVKAWYNEVSDYTYSSNVCAAGKACGHYTQVMWAMTEELGCAYKWCDTLKNASISPGLIVVCNYGPPGNYVGQKPYDSADRCAQCPAGNECEYNKLCIKSGTSYNIPATAPDSDLKCSDGGGNSASDGSGSNSTAAMSPHLSKLAIFASTVAVLTIVV